MDSVWIYENGIEHEFHWDTVQPQTILGSSYQTLEVWPNANF